MKNGTIIQNSEVEIIRAAKNQRQFFSPSFQKNNNYSLLITLSHISARYENRFLRGAQNNYVISDISFSIAKNEMFALIGESGSGKTTLARCLSGIISHNGGYTICGKDFSSLTQKEKSSSVQIVFQNPYMSLNPARTVRHILEEPLIIHRTATKYERGQKARKMLAAVSLDESFLARYPRELSGGERQRVAIASALMLNPKLLIADEILSSLDRGVQQKIIELLLRLKKQFEFSVLFVTHDISLALSLCDRIAVMKNGRIIEIAKAENIGADEYTKELLNAAGYGR